MSEKGVSGNIKKTLKEKETARVLGVAPFGISRQSMFLGVLSRTHTPCSETRKERRKVLSSQQMLESKIDQQPTTLYALIPLFSS